MTASLRPRGLTALALRLSVALVLVFAFGIAALPAFPGGDDHALAFLTPPDGCPMPCWQGIRPGVTTADEALALLRTHPWGGVINARNYNAVTGDGIIAWLLDDAYLRFIERFRGVRLRVVNHVVYNVTLPSGIPLGDVWFAFGRPRQVRRRIISVMHSDAYRLEQLMVYDASGVYVVSRARCPATLAGFWAARSIVQLGVPLAQPSLDPVVFVGSADRHDVRDLLREQAHCRA